MEHRHLNHQRFTLAAIDDVIARGKWQDWAALRQAALADPAVLERIRRVCAARLAGEREGPAPRMEEPSAGVREGPAPRMEEPSAGEREGPAPRVEEPSAGVREGPAPRMEKPSAGEREGPAPRMEEPSAGEREGLAPRIQEPYPQRHHFWMHWTQRHGQTDDADAPAS